MSGRKCGEIAGSSRGGYIRNIADIPELSEIVDFGYEEYLKIKNI